METPRNAFLAGFKTISPLFLGALPFGLITGVTAVAAGLSLAEGVGMSGLVFAGASQLAALQLIGTGGAIAIIWFTVFVINLRHVMYSASIAPHFRSLSLGWRLLLPVFMADQPYGLAIVRFEEEPQMAHKKWYYLGLGAPLWLMWTAATAVGVLVGAQIPPAWGLDFVIPLVFLVIIFPAIKDRPAALAAVVSGVVATLARPWPYNLGLMTGALSGIVAGLAADSVWGEETVDE